MSVCLSSLETCLPAFLPFSLSAGYVHTCALVHVYMKVRGQYLFQSLFTLFIFLRLLVYVCVWYVCDYICVNVCMSVCVIMCVWYICVCMEGEKEERNHMCTIVLKSQGASDPYSWCSGCCESLHVGAGNSSQGC